jgi:hypothetical protein
VHFCVLSLSQLKEMNSAGSNLESALDFDPLKDDAIRHSFVTVSRPKINYANLFEKALALLGSSGTLEKA